MDEEMVVCGYLRLAGRVHDDDRECGGSRDVGVSAIDAEGKDGIHRYQCVVFPGGEFAEGAVAGLCVEEYHLGIS